MLAFAKSELKILIAVILGAVGAIAALRWAQSSARRSDVVFRSSSVVTGVLLMFGGATGVFAARDFGLPAVVLAIVAALLVVQTPIDLATHRLLRLPTSVATEMIALMYCISLLNRGWRLDVLVSLGSALAVVVLFGVLQRISPHSLGWGDVLLVAPLALAVAFVSVSQLPLWLMVAACTSAIHGVVLRWLRGEQMLPFGPHLLFAAWLVLVTSV
jgi:prepilin signal peptidase PulO-like enzyme (type II secretory pathway)